MLQVGSGARGRQVDLADQQRVVAGCLAQRRERPAGPGRVARVATDPGPARAPAAAGRRARRTAGRRAARGPSRAGRSHRGGSRPPHARSRTAPRPASPPRPRACASRGPAAPDRRSAGTSARWMRPAPMPARRRPTSSCSAARRPSRPRCTSRDARGTRHARSRCGRATRSISRRRPRVVGLGQRAGRTLQAAEPRVDVRVVGDVVAPVGQRRRVDGREPQRVHAQPLQVVEAPR